MIKYTLQRLDNKSDSSVGALYRENQFLCFTIEDEKRDVKVEGETRIPAGTYEVKLREVVSPLTKKYRSKFKWFDWHLEIQDVPDFNWVYIHLGNFESNTDGCLLVNKGVNIVDGQWVGSNSTQAFEEVYKLMREDLNQGRVYIFISDEDYLTLPF